MELLLNNLIAGKVRETQFNGRDFLVAPATLIVPGVLPGSKGPLYYPHDEVAKDPSMWNGMPLVVNHPFESDGVTPASARSPKILEKYGVGFVFNAEFKSKLGAELWFDVLNTTRIEPRIITWLRAGHPFELSTGLFTQNNPRSGVFNGRKYSHIARNYRPDHLAILPDERGACSRKDGCGVLVNQETPMTCNLVEGVCLNCGGKGSGVPGPCPGGGGGAHKPGQKVKITGGIFAGKSAKVVKSDETGVTVKFPDFRRKGVSGIIKGAEHHIPHTSDKPTATTTKHLVANQSTNSEDQKMKDKLIEWLTTNCSCWKGEDDAETLNGFSEDKLKSLKAKEIAAQEAEAVVNAAREGFGLDKSLTVNALPAAIKAKGKPKAGCAEPDEDEEPAVMNMEQWEASMPPEAKAVWNSAKQVANREKRQVINALTKHIADPAKRKLAVNKLKDKTLEDLVERLELMPAPVVNRHDDEDDSDDEPIVNYGGAGGGRRKQKMSDEDKSDFLEVATLNFDKDGDDSDDE